MTNENEMIKHEMINLSSGYVSLSEHTLEGQEILISISRDNISISYHLSKADFKIISKAMNKF